MQFSTVFRVFFFYMFGDHPNLPVLPHSCPTRRSSDLIDGRARPACLKRAGHLDPDCECLSQDHPKLDLIHTSHSVADISYIKGKGSPRCQIDARREDRKSTSLNSSH